MHSLIHYGLANERNGHMNNLNTMVCVFISLLRFDRLGHESGGKNECYTEFFEARHVRKATSGILKMSTIRVFSLCSAIA